MTKTHTHYTIEKATKVLFDGMGTTLKGYAIYLHYADGTKERFSWNKYRKSCVEEAKVYSL